jgi:hypothetical protein
MGDAYPQRGVSEHAEARIPLPGSLGKVDMW